MAQDPIGKTPRGIRAHNAAVAVTAALTTLLDIPTDGISFLGVAIEVSGANALDQFEIQGRTHPDGVYQTLKAAIAAGGIITDASGALETLASGLNGWVVVNVLGFNDIRIQAASAGTSTVTATATGKL